MRNSPAFAALAVVSFTIMPMVASAQTFEKKNYNYSEWTKGRFSEAVTVTGPGKMIFLAGVGSEDAERLRRNVLWSIRCSCPSSFRTFEPTLPSKTR